MKLTETEKFHLMLTLADSFKIDSDSIFTLSRQFRAEMWATIHQRNDVIEEKEEQSIEKEIE